MEATKVNNYSKCPNCGYWAFDGSQCNDCGYQKRKGDPLLPTIAAAAFFALLLILSFGSFSQSVSKAVKTHELTTSVRCKAQTKAGAECRLMTYYADSLCHLHRKPLATKGATK